MRVYQLVLIAIVAGAALPIALHHRAYGSFDADQIAVASFLWLNVIIALWELCLFFRIDHIAEQSARFKVEYKGRELDRVVDYFGTKVPFARILSPTLWAEIWSSYSVFDESYADRKSFGFAIDVGNGFTTLAPALLCIYGITFHFIAARALGLVLLILNYQMWYGTLVYFGTFVLNKRYVGHTRRNLILFVAATNGAWFTLPLWGMYAALTMIYTNGYSIFTLEGFHP